MKKIATLFFSFCFCLPSFASFSTDTISIKDAIDKGLVSVIVRGLGGHSGECLEMNIQNESGTDLILSLEAGRTMIPEDTIMQDILITKQYDFLLSKTEKARLNILGMCMKALRHSPSKDSRFRVGKMADSLLVQLAKFMDKSNYRNTASQNAVWVLSDGNPLESIHFTGNDAQGKILMELMHKLTKKPIPWYSLEYAKDSVILFTGKAEAIHGYYEYYVPSNSIVTIGIYKEDGHLQTVLFSRQPHGSGRHDYPFSLDVSKWEKGNYFLRLYIDDQVKEKRVIKL